MQSSVKGRDMAGTPPATHAMFLEHLGHCALNVMIYSWVATHSLKSSVLRGYFLTSGP